MDSRAMRIFVAAAALIVGLPAGAQDAGCDLPATEGHPLADRVEGIALFERLPQHCLKQVVRDCTMAAGEAVLDMGAASLCSFGYEALLRKGFDGDFQALLAWWREERQAAAD